MTKNRPQKRKARGNKGGSAGPARSRITKPGHASTEKEGRHNHNHSKKKAKRVRGQKPKIRRILGAGELPTEKRLKGGGIRKFDILRSKGKEDEYVPQRAKEMMASIARLKERSSSLTKPAKQSAQPRPSKEPPLHHQTPPPPVSSEQALPTVDSPTALKAEGEGIAPTQPTSDMKADVSDEKDTQTKKTKLFQGMLPGENYTQFSARIRKESRKMVIATAKKLSHQHKKKKAHYKKREKGIERRKRRRRGEYSDSDVEAGGGDDQGDGDQDWDESESKLNQLPMYWQEIVRNNGRPLSDKKRRRMERMEEQESDHVRFGEQVERPPELTVVPNRRRGKSS